MRSGMIIEITAEYSKVFDDSPTLDNLLQGVSRSTLLKISSFFLGFANKDSEFHYAKEFIQMLFGGENNTFANEVYVKIRDNEDRIAKETGSRKLTIIANHITSLCLFEYAYNKLDEVETLSEAEIEVNVFKAYLLINEINTNKTHDAWDSVNGLELEDPLSAKVLTMSYGYSDLINYGKRELIITQIIKSIHFFEFLESDRKTLPILNAFYEYFHVESWKEYMTKLLPIAFECIQKKNEAHVDVVFKEDENYQTNIDFMNKLIIEDTVELQEHDFSSLRANPFYRVDKHTYRVIYDLFVYEMLHKGLYFKMSVIHRSLPKTQRIGDFRSYYCNDFSENYILYSTIQHMYGRKYRQFSGSQILALGYEAEPDYYMRNGNKAFLFESKDVLVKAKDKTSYDFPTLEAIFKKKFYFDTKENGDVEKKAILQLIFNIKRILKQEFDFDTGYRTDTIRIYPILVTHHHQYDVAGLNNLLKTWFKDEVSKLQQEGLPIGNIRPITLINIDDLIFHQDQFNSKKIKLEDIIDSYHKHVTFNPNRRYRSESEVNIHKERTFVPFSTFLTTYVGSKIEIKAPKLIMEQGFKMFN